MTALRRALAMVPVLALGAQLTAFAQGACVDKANGFQFQPPKDWTQVPIQVEEKWIATKWLCDKKYDDKESGFTHNPLMRVIIFEKAKILPGGDETGSGGSGNGGVDVKPGDEIDLSRPYVDYKDYLKRNFRDGGFYVSAEKEVKMGETPVTMLEVKIEKLVQTGKKRIYCWIFKAEWGDLAIECEVLEQFVDKLQPTVMNAFKSFRLIARDPNAKKENVGGGPKIKFVDPNETPEMQKKRRLEMEDRMFKKAIADLPKDWTTKRTAHFLVLNHAGVKYQDKVIAHAEAVRTWLDKEFGDIGPGYVQGCILRICKDRDEERAFGSGSGDSWSNDSRELITSESKDGLNPYEFQYLGRGVMNFFFYDKNSELYSALPTWLENGLRGYIGTAVLKANQLQFGPDDSEKTRMNDGAKKGKFKPIRDLVNVTQKDMFGGEDGQYLYAQCTSLIRYLMGPGRGVKKHSTIIKDYLRHLLDVMKENEKAARDAVKAAGGAKTEEEEEEEFRKRRKQDWSAKEKEFLQAVMKAVFGDWTDGDWAGLQASWEKFAK